MTLKIASIFLIIFFYMFFLFPKQKRKNQRKVLLLRPSAALVPYARKAASPFWGHELYRPHKDCVNPSGTGRAHISFIFDKIFKLAKK